MPDQPRSFCDEMIGSMDEERAILSFTLALGKASDAGSHVILAGSLGGAWAVWLKGGSRVQALVAIML